MSRCGAGRRDAASSVAPIRRYGRSLRPCLTTPIARLATGVITLGALETYRCRRLGGPVERLERPGLRDGVLAAEEAGRPSVDRVCDVLELEPVRVHNVEL